MAEMTQRRLEILVRAVIAEYSFPVSLHLVDQAGNGAWRVTVDTPEGGRSSFTLAPACSPDMYFAVKENLQGNGQRLRPVTLR